MPCWEEGPPLCSINGALVPLTLVLFPGKHVQEPGWPQQEFSAQIPEHLSTPPRSLFVHPTGVAFGAVPWGDLPGGCARVGLGCAVAGELKCHRGVQGLKVPLESSVKGPAPSERGVRLQGLSGDGIQGT